MEKLIANSEVLAQYRFSLDGNTTLASVPYSNVVLAQYRFSRDGNTTLASVPYSNVQGRKNLPQRRIWSSNPGALYHEENC
jgi:hypothetical protein